ncbi:hypothetical protein M404DRAFT_32710 [Pisolithus tinctorius Marx 270]|uniref:Uncharacterized protein n=1 Tax=Pisolithus tinctorius Marx 270 TaxID=870435 RepID=A0A0C3JHA3_PISTI|nr:hypothetical protein M404DRAFT_32710 [Pisolithus tinctorius Marx 270]
MQAYSVNDTRPVFSMRDQVTMALAAALGHVWDLIEGAPQPEERLETIYVWVEDWDKTWASICSWWKYVDDNGISVLKVHDECMHNYTKESVMCQSLLVLGAIAIADFHHPVEQRQIHIDDIFEDYQERVELRVQLKAERLTREPSMLMCRQAAMVEGEGQGHAPSNTEAGESSSGTGQQVRQQTEGTGKGKGKEKATDEVDELENDEGEHPPNPDPSKTGAPAAKADLQCREHPTPRASPPSTSNMPPPPTPRPPLFLPSETPAPRPHPELTLPPMDNPGDLGDGGLFGRPTGLLDDPPAPVISVQDESKGPPVEETLQVANLSELTTHETLAECI